MSGGKARYSVCRTGERLLTHATAVSSADVSSPVRTRAASAASPSIRAFTLPIRPVWTPIRTA